MVLEPCGYDTPGSAAPGRAGLGVVGAGVAGFTGDSPGAADGATELEGMGESLHTPRSVAVNVKPSFGNARGKINASLTQAVLPGANTLAGDWTGAVGLLNGDGDDGDGDADALGELSGTVWLLTG
jgi:hypothetical protein